MSAEFRQRTPAEYARIIWKRKWLVILPAIAIAAAICIVVWRLPNVYESTTLLIVRPSTIPNAIVPTLSDVDLSLRINNIGQVVVSRSSLEPLIMKYGLYASERERGMPMELLIEKMRKDIVVEIDKSRNDITNAFRISYRERDPRTTQMVTSELAGKYISAQMEATTTASKTNVDFFERQLEEAKKELDEINAKRIEFMMQNKQNLPSQTQALVGRLTGLREQEKALIADVGRLQDQHTALNNQIAIIKKNTQVEKEQVAENLTDPKTTLGWAELVKRKADLEAGIQNMLQTLRPANPDVKAAQAQLDAVQREMDRLVDEWKEKIKEKQEKLDRRPDIGVANFETQLQLNDGNLKRTQAMLDQTEADLADINSRLNNVPPAEIGLDAINNEYQTKKLEYDQLLDKMNKVKIASDVAVNAQGETLQVIDPANLPQKPVAPKRYLLMPLGLVLGLMVGLALAASLEVPRLLTIQTTEDVRHYTGLPVLISVPELLTPQEARRIPVRRKLALAAGIAAAMFSIPALALILKLTHVFDLFVS